MNVRAVWYHPIDHELKLERSRRPPNDAARRTRTTMCSSEVRAMHPTSASLVTRDVHCDLVGLQASSSTNKARLVRTVSDEKKGLSSRKSNAEYHELVVVVETSVICLACGKAVSRDKIVVGLIVNDDQYRHGAMEKGFTYGSEEEEIVRELGVAHWCERNALPLSVDECLIRRITYKSKSVCWMDPVGITICVYHCEARIERAVLH